MVDTAVRGFSLNAGGPFDQLSRKLHLLRPSGVVRSWWLIAIVWLPIVVGATLRFAFARSVSPLVTDIGVHVRFLVGLPMVFASSALLESQCRGAVRMLYEGDMAEHARLDPIVDAGERLRSSALVEGLIVIIALVFGQLAMWEVTGPTGVFHGIEHHAEWSFARIWYGTVSLPLLQFLLLRWVWRWAVWTYMLVRFSRLSLAATASHPDHAAGLSSLAWPLGGFASLVLAVSAVLAGEWATQLLDHRITVPSLGPTLVVFFAIALFVGYSPLLLFSGQLYRAKRRDLANHGLFALDYVRKFDSRWIAGGAGAQLGTSDIQSLNDIGGAFQVVLTTRLTVFDLLRIKNLALAIVVPMLPLLLTTVSVQSMISKLGGALLGI
jgi:hypothetical protein